MADEIQKSLYTKYRPVTIAEYSGKRIKDLVAQRFKQRATMPHVVMIHGTRGCGKTTFCRIISKYYLCENPGPDGTPCEECDTCQSINEYLITSSDSGVECPGVREINANVMNGKEAIQEVLDEALQPPIYTQFKVLIMDECHEISRVAQNSMLKIIEDIPEHLVVFFATTDPQKVIQTIKSRCQLTIEVRKQTVKDMADRLYVISQKEGYKISREALEIIAKKGDRVPRECINILEDVAMRYDGQITIENVKQLVGGMASEKYIEFFKAANTSLGDVVAFIRELKDADVKYKDFISGLVGFVMDSLYIKHGIALDEYPLEYTKAVKQLFDLYDSNDFDMLLQIVENLSNQSDTDNTDKLEMLLTLTAVRIGKVNLLANDLAQEQREAVVENKRSLYEHSKMLKRDTKVVAEKLKIALDIGNLKESFEDLAVVRGTAGLLDDVQIPKIDYSQTDNEDNTDDEETINDDIVDSFLGD